MSSQAGISSCRLVSSAFSGTTPSFFCCLMIFSRSTSQPSSNLPLYLSDHSLGTWCGRVGGAGREVHEERLVGHQRLLLAHPGDRAVGEILGERVALLGRLRRLDRRGALVQPGVVLVGLAADEAVEVLEARSGGPLVERAGGRDLPDRHLVTLAELGGRIAVELQGFGDRRLLLGPDAVVPGAEVAISVIAPMPTEWWLRPVSIACRVGEHSAVV